MYVDALSMYTYILYILLLWIVLHKRHIMQANLFTYYCKYSVMKVVDIQNIHTYTFKRMQTCYFAGK